MAMAQSYCSHFDKTESGIQIKEKFGDCLERASRGELDNWKETPRGRVALVLVLDQFSRNCHRNSSRGYAQDEAALQIAVNSIEQVSFVPSASCSESPNDILGFESSAPIISRIYEQCPNAGMSFLLILCSYRLSGLNPLLALSLGLPNRVLGFEFSAHIYSRLTIQSSNLGLGQILRSHRHSRYQTQFIGIKCIQFKFPCMQLQCNHPPRVH